MKTTSLLRCASLATALALGAAAHAGPVRAVANGLACSAADLGDLSSDCLGYATGNDSNAALATLVGSGEWHGLSLAGLTRYKDDDKLAGSTTALFDVQQSATDASRGVLTLLQDLNGPFVLTLKGGNQWAAYYVGAGVKAGDTFQFDIPGVQGAGLSHASIYTATVPTAPTPTPAVLPPAPSAVPEPGALALVALALGGAAVASRRSRRSRTA